ncbi:hypothetical protein Pcinc_007914 [Petrolisthes cinctipes]|uniref:Uncharacterized protein n=1 Tax=Petrolisthes cinctipes TaxID=88211 RepID=A0AAE1GAA7_PETCI|nr:hypothetical protein Pcinc_007914 [Petrolisthes cinctipes]
MITKNTVQIRETPCTVDQITCNPEDIPCSLDHECNDIFPHLDLAVALSVDTTLQPEPICLGFLGSRCVNDSCTHNRSHCGNSYCSCDNGGIFYELSYCAFPSIGYQAALQMAIFICIIIALCFIAASVYSVILSRRRLTRIPETMIRQRRPNGDENDNNNNEATSQGPAEDIPPTYDDVVDKLPSYQDAVEMSSQYASITLVED